VDVAVVATVFALVALAELPDKTMIATLVMGSRSRPALVWVGAAAAFICHVTLAVAAGRLLELLPHRALEAVVTVLFLGGAVYLLFVPEKEEEARGEAEAATAADGTRAEVSAGDGPVPTESGPDVRPPSGAPWKVIWTAFAVIGVGEFGDLTQLLTINLTAKYHRPLSVWVGAVAGLLFVSALAAVSGRALLRVLPLSIIRRGGGVVLLGFAAYSIYALTT
jgi:putative Ca2+/H+ antiporter (TMEM165/GDT1 family)